MGLVKSAAQGDLDRARQLAYEYLADVSLERARAEAAAEYLERWVHGEDLFPRVNVLPVQYIFSAQQAIMQ